MNDPFLNLIPRDGELYFYEHFLPWDEAQQLFTYFEKNLKWQEESILMFGKPCKVPRLVCWYGDPGAHYQYSGTAHSPLPWDAELQKLRLAIEAYSGHVFNAVLGNLYRNEKDSVGWHSDNEPELGKDPVIASLSLGETRRFSLRHKSAKSSYQIDLPSGSLLLMKGSLQANWKHALLKEKHPCGARINLTFRRLYGTQ